jgi:hypothetical protein
MPPRRAARLGSPLPGEAKKSPGVLDVSWAQTRSNAWPLSAWTTSEPSAKHLITTSPGRGGGGRYIPHIYLYIYILQYRCSQRLWAARTSWVKWKVLTTTWLPKYIPMRLAGIFRLPLGAHVCSMHNFGAYGDQSARAVREHVWDSAAYSIYAVEWPGVRKKKVKTVTPSLFC